LSSNRESQNWNERGILLTKEGNFTESIECYDKALEINPTDIQILKNKFYSLSYLGKHEEAIECYDKILYINPNDLNA